MFYSRNCNVHFNHEGKLNTSATLDNAAPILSQVLVMAGQLKRENPDLQEDVVLIRALRDSNLPKFLADDAILFKVSSSHTQSFI